MTVTHADFPPHLTPFERARLEGLLARLTTEPRLSRVVVFGSRARGRSRPDSDLDLSSKRSPATSRGSSPNWTSPASGR